MLALGDAGRFSEASEAVLEARIAMAHLRHWRLYRLVPRKVEAVGFERMNCALIFHT
jgi:hypothetical protein